MGGDMREILDAQQVSRLFVVLALILPPLCALGGFFYGRRRQPIRNWALYGFLIGLLGPLNLAMWHVYNGITDALGLDTVRNLAVNVVLFVLVGTLIGVGAGAALRRARVNAGALQPQDKAE